MITAWLIKNEFYNTHRLDQQFAMLCHAFENRSIILEIKTNADFCIPLSESLNFKLPTFAIMWDKDILLAERLESLGIKLFNSANAIALCDDKMLMHLAFQKSNLPTPLTILAPMTYNNIGYTNLNFLNNAVAKLGFPLIIKEAKSSYGLGVFKANNFIEAKQILTKISYPIVFQQYIATSCGRDIRVNVVGSEVVCAVERVNKNDFRSNVLQGGSMQQIELNSQICSLALQASKSVGCDFCGIDILYDKNNQFLVCEVNTSAHIGTIFAITGIDLSQKIADYIISKIL